jgi:fused signal recognition particle receptor
MAFSLFGKRDSADSATPQPESPEPPKPSLFEKMRAAVSRTRSAISDKLDTALAFTRAVSDDDLARLESILITSDLGAATARAVIDSLRRRAAQQGIEGGSELRALLKSELRAMLDSVATPTPAVASTEVILMVGVNGTGKTTTCGKLAALHSAAGRKVLLCAADTFRAAAIEQLEVWAARSSVEIIKTRQGGDPSAALFDALAAARARSIDLLIVDTAGRLHTKSGLMDELSKMRRTAQKTIPDAPHQVLLVMDATTGQNGLQQARLFTGSAGVTGIVLTKLDGTAKGGIVIAIARELNLPVRYVGTGETMTDLLPFDSEAFVDSLLDG